jgi:hypothetical protein
LLAAFLLLSVSAITAMARPASGSHAILGEEQGYRSLLYMHLRSREKPDGAGLTARSRDNLRQLAAVIPGERRTAHLFFPSGRTAEAVEVVLDKSRLDLYVLTVNVTTPEGDELLPLSEATVGSRSGTISRRIEAAVRHTLGNARNRKRRLPEDAAYAVVEIGIIGSISELRKLADSGGDFVFSFRPSARIASAFGERYSCYQEHGPAGCATSIHDIPAGAQPEAMGEAVAQALGRYLKTQDLGVISKKLVDAAHEAKADSTRAPRQRRAAQVFLKYPVDGFEIQSLLDPLSLEMTTMETAVAESRTPARFMTKHFDAKQLALGDSIEERIDIAWARERVNSQDTTVRNSNNNVVLRVDVVGTRESLNDLWLSSRVQGVFVDEDGVVAQRPDADDPRPERGMKRLEIPGGPAIPEIVPMPRAPIAQAEDLRKLARERPKERRIAVLLLRRDSSIEDVARLLDETRLKFLNHRPAVVVSQGASPITLAPEILVRQSGSLGQQLRGAAVEAGAIEDTQNLRVLRLGIEGEAADLVRLMDDARVFTVMADSAQL